MDFLDLKILLRTLLLPPASPLIGAALGFAMLYVARFRKVGLILCGLSLTTLWLLSTPVVAGQLMKWAQKYPVLDLRQPVAADAIIVLAGGIRRYAPEYNDEAPNEVTLQRMTFGVRVARLKGLPMLVTGGRGEALIMEDFLIKDFGIMPRWIEDQARDTHENAIYSTRILKAEGIDTAVLVTSALHMPRAVEEFRSAGLNVVPAPVAQYAPPQGIVVRWIPGMAGLRDSHAVLFETLAITAYRLGLD